MKRLLLFLLLIPAFAYSQGQTYWPNGVPPGTTPFSPTFRSKSTGTDSLTDIYLAVGNKTFKIYTAPQSWSYWSRLFKGDPKDPLNPLTIAIGDSTVTSFNNFGIGTNANGDIVYMPFNYSPSMGYILFTQKINANSGLQTNASIASGVGTFLKQNTSTGLVEKDTSHYQTALSFGGGLTLSGTAVSLGGAILSGNTAGIELQYDGVNSTNFNVLDANTGTGIITGNSASGTETALSSARSDFVYTTLLDLNEGGVSLHATHGLKAMGFSWNASTTAPISVTDSINNKGLANTSDYSAYEVLNDNAYMSRKAVRVYGNTLWATAGSAPTAANPTATAGVSAVNGSALTFMRSDAAPKIDSAAFRTTANSYSLAGIQTKLNNYVPTSRTLTINGTAFDLSANRSWTISAGDAPMNGLKKYGTDSVGMGNAPITHYVNMPIKSGAYVLMGDTTNFVGLYVDDTSAGISGEDTVNNYNSNITAGNNGTALMKVTNGSIQRYIKSSVQPSDPLGGSVIHYDSENKPIIGSGNYWTGSNGSLLHDSAYIQTGGVKSLLTGYVPTSRTVSTSTGLTGGGDLSANLTLKADTATLQTVLNFFPKGDTRYLKSSVISGLANPTATIGFTAVNGSAITGTRSDGAPKADSTVIRSVANSYSLSGMQTKLNNYVKYTDTTAAFGNLVHINKAETILGPKTFSKGITVNLSSASPSTTFGTETAQFNVATDGSDIVNETDVFGTNHGLDEVWAGAGTAASPTATGNNREIRAIAGSTYVSAGTKAAEAITAIQMFTSEVQDATHNGSHLSFLTTKKGVASSTGLTVNAQLNDDGSFGIAGNHSVGALVPQNVAAYSGHVFEIDGTSSDGTNVPHSIILGQVGITSGNFAETDRQSSYNSSGSYAGVRDFASLVGSTTNNKGTTWTFQTKIDGGAYATVVTYDQTQVATFNNAPIVSALTASKLVFTDANKKLTSTGIGTSSQGIDGSGGLYSLNSKPHTIFTPTTGGTVSLTNNQYNIINPAGALLALTVNLPSSPANNDCVFIKFTQNVTTVTYGNGTVVDGITAPTAGGLTVLTYDSGTTSWY